jgi:DNA-binding helix-hairpin-helix protein with protein kinase domain
MKSSIEYSSISGIEKKTELGRGGEGVVYGLPSANGLVYKEFLASAYTTPDLSALERLIEVRGSWSPEERVWLDARTVWPDVTVLSGGVLKGFLMPSIHQRFIRKHGIRSNPKTVLCEWNYLTHRAKFVSNSNIYSEVPRVDHLDALALVFDLAQSIAMLHKHGVIIGDLSGKNLLWTNSPSLQVMIIDNDSFRLTGTGGVASPKQSPDWDDPFLVGKPTSQESDIYKLGLAAFRAIWSSGTDRPTFDTKDLTTRLDGIPETVMDVVWDSLRAEGRPTAADWVSVLSVPARLKGRPALSLNSNRQPARKSTAPTTGDGIPRPPRPLLQLGDSPRE